MELYIFNKNLEFLGLIDNFTSFRWVRKFYATGEFELHLPITTDNLNLLKLGNIIVTKNDTECGIINYRNLKLNTNMEEELVIKGSFIKSVLNRRIIWETVNYQNNLAELIMLELVYNNVINPSLKQRKINNIILGQVNNFTEKISKQISYKNLLESIEDITLTSNIGTRLDFNISNKQLIFNSYKGLNRSINQNTNTMAIFSSEFDNILEQDYTHSTNNYRNVAMIGGVGEGKDRKITTINNTNFGDLDRYEIFIDARDIEDKITVNKVETVITREEYNKLLEQRGWEHLKEYVEVESFNSKINTKQSNLIYKKDYDLGDIVTCINKKWGIKVDTKIVEIEEIYEQNGQEIYVTFGDELPTLIQKIKKGMM